MLFATHRRRPAQGKTAHRNLHDARARISFEENLKSSPDEFSGIYIPFLSYGLASCEAVHPSQETLNEENDRPVLIQQADEIAKSKPEIISCPGQFQDQFNRTKHLVSVDTWDGIRIDLHKSLTATFASSYNLLLGSSVVPGGNAFTFGSTVVEANNKLIMGRITKGGDLDARIHYPIGPVQSKVNIAIGQVDQVIGMIEMNDSCSTCQITLGPEIFGFNFNQALTPRLSVGMEMQYSEKQKIAPISVGCAYSTKDWVANSLYSPTGSPNGMIQLQYSRVVSERTQVGAELAMNPMDPTQSIVNIGAEFNLRQSKLHFGVNGSGVVESNVEVRFLPNASVVFAGQLNHAEDKHRFGFGLQMQT